jgi:diguanylate cyclase (GGDEF)-like protein
MPNAIARPNSVADKAGKSVHGSLAARCASFEHDNALLRETLDNMTQGVVMFGADATLVVSNDRYIEMYGLSKDVIKPGCTLRQLLEHRGEVGLLTGDIGKYHDDILEQVRRREVFSWEVTTADGRAIHIVNKPMAGGGWVVTHEDVTQQREFEARIAHMAHHDALTDLPNRTLFGAQLEAALRWLKRDEQLAVLFLDLDNFKNINDTLGHQVGDALLKTVAERLRGCIRETDEVARLGGDEFVIVQTRVGGPADVAQFARRVREAIMQPYDLGDHHVVVDTSIGIALAPGDGATSDELIKNADLALYGAKASGRGTFRFFEQAMDVKMMARLELELDLRRALVNGEFEIHYQPLVNLKEDRISACEALLRWNHPVRGEVGPDSFIPVAEESGLITRIGDWVIRTACEEAATWPDDITLAINISPVQFRNENLIQVVTHALATSGLKPERLELEITEAILLEHTEATLETLNRLRSFGIRIAMDDFGTGYSSLSYLQKFPFDKIKIDGSFVNGLSDAPESSAVIRAVTGLASSFRMVTTAEGVETEEQLAMVRSLGCTEMQGYLFSKARSAADLAELLAVQGGRLGTPRTAPVTRRGARRPSRLTPTRWSRSWSTMGGDPRSDDDLRICRRSGRGLRKSAIASNTSPALRHAMASPGPRFPRSARR